MSRLKQLIHEIHRRSLWQVLLIYAAGGWAVLAAVDTLAGALALPEWAPRLALFLLIIGLPIVLATSFVQEGLRSDSEAEAPHREKVRGVQAHGSAPTPRRGSDDGGSAVRRLLTWRNAFRGGLAALAGWGAVAAVWVLFVGPPEGRIDESVPVSRDVVAVLPFSVQGDRSVEYLDEGIVHLLSTKLDGAGDLRTADPQALLTAVRRSGSQAIDPSGGGRIARQLGAGRYVLGSVVEAGGRLTITATMYEGAAGRIEELGEATAQESTERVFEAVDELAVGLLSSLGTGPGARVRHVAAVTTGSLPALKAYLEGEQAYRSGEYQAAVEALRTAVSLDPDYALAHYRLSVVAEMSTLSELAQEAAEKAFQHADRLSERDRRLLQAFLAWRRGEHGEAERRYRALVGSYPDEVEAWFELGEVLFHANPLHGRSFAEARDPFRRVLDYDPVNAAAMYHLGRIAAAEGRFAQLDSLTERHTELSRGGDRELEMLALRAFAHGDSAARAEITARLRNARDVELGVAAWVVTTWSDNIAGGERLARLMTDPSRSREVRSQGHAWLAHIALARGRPADAEAELDRLAGLDSVAELEYRTLVSLMPHAGADRRLLGSLVGRLNRLEPSEVPASGNPSIFYSVHDDLHHVLREYLLGAASARLGRAADAHGHAERLERLAVSSEHGSTTSDLAASVRAQALWEDGRVEEALEALNTIQRQLWYVPTLASPFSAQALERFLTAEMLFESGRYEEALPWYETIAQIAPFEVAYRPLGRLRMAEIHDAQGRRDEAAVMYRAFLEMWSDADPRLQARVEAAKERLEEIAAEPS